MDLESIMLNEISHRQILYDLIYMWNLKTNAKKKREREIRFVITRDSSRGRRIR